MDIKCSLETRFSEKSKKDYQVFVIKITDTYEKVVFAEPADIEILKLSGKLKIDK